MAELRTCEKEISELQSMYEALRQGNDKLAQGLPPLTTILLVDSAATATAATATTNSDDDTNAAPATTSLLSPTFVLERMQAMQAKLVNHFQPRMEKFRKRMLEKDPVTDKPRYGEQTLQRVQTLLSAFQELQSIMAVAFYGNVGGQESTSTTTTTTTTDAAAVTTAATSAAAADSSGNSMETTTSTATPVIHEIKSLAQQEQERAAEAARIQAEKEEQERIQHEMMQRQLEQQELQAAEAIRLQAEQQQAELEQRAHQVRQAQLREQELANRADREWMNSIEKGPDGVRKQLQILNNSTAHDISARRVAINALYRLFSQIIAHPEEIKFRRVRRNHEQFQQDIGQHAGGQEILIAAGFVTANVIVADDNNGSSTTPVPCFISKEPNIEKDMDAWAAWFDLLKATLQIIEQEMIQTK